MMQSNNSTARRSRLRRWLLPATLFALLLTLAGGAWFWWQQNSADDTTNRYMLSTVKKGDIEEVVSATGSVQPRQYVDVGAQVSGQLKRIAVELGSEVKAGDLLAEIDATVFRSTVDAGRAQLRGLRAQQNEREAQLTLVRLQLQRQQGLMAAEAGTAEQLQQAEATVAASQAQLAAIKAQIDASQSSLQADEARLDYARLYAPISGTVVSISARQGQTLNANQQAPIILRIADLSTVTVQTQVSEADVGKLRRGMAVYFTTLGNQNRRWQGTLRAIEPTPVIQNNVVLYNALFDVPNEHGRLMTQMTAQVFFVVAAAQDVLLIPVSALESSGKSRRAGDGGIRSGTRESRREQRQTGSKRRSQSATVRVVRADGSIEQRRVQLGISNRIEVEVRSGLAVGEQVISGEKQAPTSARNKPGGALGMPGPMPGGSRMAR